jgi:hypothetical protein
MLSNRLGIADILQRHPEIDDIPIERPIFIVGWFRSGTTLLHRMLSQGEGVRFPRAWELFFPVPGPGDRDREARRRLRRMRRYLGLAHTVIPALREMHPIEAESAEESSVLLDNEGVGVYFVHAFGAMSHGRFLGDRDLGYAYRSLRRQLQLLSWAGGRGRWVLKCPFTMWKLDELLDVFPDACIVHTHRDAGHSVPSVCSLSAILQHSFCENVDLQVIGRFWSDFCLEGLKRSLAFRRSHPRIQVIDVHFSDLVADPAGVVRRVASHLDLRIAPTAFDTPLAAGSSKHGRHDYDLADFGLDAGELDERFAPFIPTADD